MPGACPASVLSLVPQCGPLATLTTVTWKLVGNARCHAPAFGIRIFCVVSPPNDSYDALEGGRCRVITVMREPWMGHLENQEIWARISHCFCCSLAVLVSVLIHGLPAHLCHMPALFTRSFGVFSGALQCLTEHLAHSGTQLAVGQVNESVNGAQLWMTAWFLSPPPGSRHQRPSGHIRPASFTFLPPVVSSIDIPPRV